MKAVITRTVTQISSPPNYRKSFERKRKKGRRENCPSHFHFRATLASIVLIKLINYHTDCVCLCWHSISSRTLAQSVPLRIHSTITHVDVRLKTEINYSLLMFFGFVVDVYLFPGGCSHSSSRSKTFHRNIQNLCRHSMMHVRQTCWEKEGNEENHKNSEGNKINVRQLNCNRFFVSEPEHSLKTVKAPARHRQWYIHISARNKRTLPLWMCHHITIWNYSCENSRPKILSAFCFLW